MKIAFFVNSLTKFPYRSGEVHAPLDSTHTIIEGLAAKGIDVTWYSPEGTESQAKVVSKGITPANEIANWSELLPYKQNQIVDLLDGVFLSHIINEAEQYDVVHFATFFHALSAARAMKGTPVVISLHNPLTPQHVQLNFDLHKDVHNLHFVSISKNQRQGRPDINYAANIYHGLDVANLPWSEKSTNRWMFVGRVVPDKGAHIAVQVAKEAGLELDIIGPNYSDDPANAQYFEKEIKPFVDGEKIRYLGSVNREELLNEKYQQYKGLLFPLQWEEPFGKTVIEAMSAGTPTVTFNKGSMAEIVEHGKTGYVVETQPEMVEAVKKINAISRQHCRQHAEKYFSIDRVIEDYLRLYTHLAGN